MKRFGLLIILVGFLGSCSEQSSGEIASYQEICGRDEENHDRSPIYRVRVPASWTRNDPAKDASNSDSTTPLCEFFIPGEDGQRIRITIYNFPTEELDTRIPPEAQVARWRGQFPILNSANMTTIAQSFSGFSGLLFEGAGEDLSVMGWAMQMAPEHLSVLGSSGSSLSAAEAYQHKQMRADFTIKATGPKMLVAKNRKAIIAFARSFELIEEIPSP